MEEEDEYECKLEKDLFGIDYNSFNGTRLNIFAMLDPQTKYVKLVLRKYYKYDSKISSANGHAEKRMTREIKTLLEMDHPCIIKIWDYNLSDGYYYMDYIPNGSLAQFQNNLTITSGSIIAYGIASALAYMHSKGFIHRDVKPENIFLDHELRPILGDFGLSKKYNGKGKHTRCGTPMFVSPEIFEDKEYTESVDVYSFGVTLFWIVHSYNKDLQSMLDLLMNIENKEVLSRIQALRESEYYKSDPLWKIGVKCTDTDPNKRASMNQVVQEIIAAFGSDEDFINFLSYKEQDPSVGYAKHFKTCCLRYQMCPLVSEIFKNLNRYMMYDPCESCERVHKEWIVPEGDVLEGPVIEYVENFTQKY